jgi:hypothetical protein
VPGHVASVARRSAAQPNAELDVAAETVQREIRRSSID